MKQEIKKGQFLTKAQLYRLVSDKATSLGFNLLASNYRINALELAHEICLDLQIDIIDFNEPKICGILYRGRNNTTIGLNARRSATGKNFDCMHELIHYMFHEKDYYMCRSDAEDHMEWQANEGAAQFLVPYQSFIPNYCRLHDRFYMQTKPERAYQALILHLSQQYAVGELVIQYRLNQLSSEIVQYLDGVAVEDIEIISKQK
ncbi:MAG: ImmA/IrrE family metallo-endopeptidase [Defluviitaleaceae bacterium]|nr:ImmA/IrrE family metallo-endopeptidase [Defluviitaleaceae bacterium]